MNAKYNSDFATTIYHWHKYTLKCSNFTDKISLKWSRQ